MNEIPGLEDRLSFAVSAAREAGDHALGYFQQETLEVEQKADSSAVTRADREAEEVIRERLGERFPEDAILGEEFGSSPGSSGYRWYLDPVDGTESFIRGVPLWGTMLGLEHDDEAVAGVIFFPALREIVYAASGNGAWHARDVPTANGVDASLPGIRPARVSGTGELTEAMFCTTSVDGYEEAGDIAAFERLRSVCRKSRGWTDCYGHYLVATGRVDVMVDAVMHVWDNAPLKPIIEEAGGRFTDTAGKPTIHGGSALSTNGLLHEAALAALAGRRVG